MLQTVELPAGVSDLAAGLANVDTDTLTLGKRYSETSLAYLLNSCQMMNIKLLQTGLEAADKTDIYIKIQTA